MNYEPIKLFSGEYFFLSNFYQLAFTFPAFGTVITAEHIYQAHKCLYATDDSPIRINDILDAPTPSIAKKLGSKVTLNVKVWDLNKVDVMREVLHYKFALPGLRSELLRTGDRMLIEGNTWGDRFWGRCRGQGNNILGVLLMEQRALLR